MSLQKILDHYGALIEGKLRGRFTEILDDARTYHPFMEKVHFGIQDFVLRKGKRLASCSTLLTYKGYAGNIDERILKACVGIELYRHCILVHDDLIDRDSLRRGGKTLHSMFAENYDTRFGRGTAVFVGNALFSLALQSLMNSGFPQEKLNKIASLLSEGYRNVNESQILDLLFEYKEPDVEEWYTMASKRAASLFKITILAGAILGGAPKQDLKVLGEAATHIGYSFDIQDDIIDTFASKEQYGRKPGGDIALGKKPLHLIYTLKLADQAESKTLKNLAGREHLSSKELQTVRAVIRKCGALEAAKQELRKHAENAKALIYQTSLSDEIKKFFASLILYIEESLEWYV